MILYVLWIATSFIIYTYLIYPLMMFIAGRLMRNAVCLSHDSDANPSITMIIIACNEERMILEKLENCRYLDYPADLFSVCVVSDGSDDRTAEILKNQNDILFIESDVNRGKPHQINNAIRSCKSELIVFSDARQMYERGALRKLARNFSDTAIGAVSGSLSFVSPKDSTGRSVGLYWRYEKILRKSESDVDSTLGVTGAIYAIRRNLVEPIPDDTILDDIEIPLRAFRKGYRVIFEDEAIAYDSASTEIKAEFRRKVRTLAGNFQLFSRNWWLMNPLKNRIFVQTLSHKVFRLLIPYAMAAVFVTSFLIDNPFYRIIFFAQIAYYAIGIIALKSSSLRSNRLINFIAVFLSLNAAAVVALYKFLTKTTDVRWRKT